MSFPFLTNGYIWVARLQDKYDDRGNLIQDQVAKEFTIQGCSIQQPSAAELSGDRQGDGKWTYTVYAPLTASVQAKDLVILSWDHKGTPGEWFNKTTPVYRVSGVPGVWSYDYLGLSHQVIKLVAVD